MSRRAAAAAPRWILLPAALGAVFILLPITALLIRIELAELPALLSSAAALSALWLSLRTAVLATVLCTVLGVPLALVLSHASFKGSGALRTLILLPLVLPPVIGGIALLNTFGRQGLLGETLDVLGIQVAFSTAAVVLAQTFVSLPFMVIAVEAALRGVQKEVVEAAVVDGAGPTQLLRSIVLPLIAPGMVSGVVLAFARSLGEFGATIAFAGSLQGVTRTLPLEIYLQRETDPDAAVALSVLLIVVAVVVIGLTRPRTAPDALR
ncbi:ABC transporter permease [Nesterenkonia lutea]|uniref:Molybdenum transport system permease n=1 Tax=Nesterenkonia lutea TaxID=272919 RepID=A0ABR9JGA3_9MICC|nr:ABC transporter permease [Nesterenkonia lutea]MBE1524803.1 molybdate transport system permease protein [Nesterenkonia lutea]